MTGFPSIEKLPEIRELPDPFAMLDGQRTATLADWRRRREEIKRLLAHYEYGQMPPAPGNVAAEETGAAATLYGGAAVQREIRLSLGPERRLTMAVTITSPQGRGPFPTIVINRRATPRSHLRPEHVESSVRRGYLVAEYAASDLQADETAELGPAKLAYPDCDWGTLAVWAWGGMRVIDHLVARPEVAADRLLVTGHSRGGKTALLTGALDERVALTVPNATGGGGFQCWRFPIWPEDPAGVNRHESVEVMSRLRTYWLSPRLAPFVDRVERLPFDQHFLAALVAPRPLCLVECMDDSCGTPICVQRTYQAVRTVYEWLGAAGKLGVYFRQKGGHAQGREDWAALLDFADLTFAGRQPESGRKFDELPYPDARPGFSWQAPARPPALQTEARRG